MTTTAEPVETEVEENVTPVPAPAVGEQVTSCAQLDALPTGSVITSPNRGRGDERKLPDGMWVQLSGDGIARPSSHFNCTEFTYMVRSIPVVPAVGDPITSAEQMDSLPMGSVIRWTRTSGATVDYTREEGGWRSEEGGLAQPDGFQMMGQNVVHSIPAIAQVGQPITDRHVMVGLPLDSIVRSTRSGNRWLRIQDGFQNLETGRVRSADRLGISGHILLEYLPPGSPINLEGIEEETPAADETPPTETFEAYVQRFRTVTFGQAQRSGVSLVPIERALTALEAPTPEPSVGMALHSSDYALISTLPQGTVAQTGEPEDWTNHGLFGIKDGSVLHLLGGVQDARSKLLTVTGLPGSADPAEWAAREATTDDVRLIRDFKARAHEIGQKAKRENSWCGDYEAAMERMGISDVDAAMFSTDPLTAEEVSALPEGSILRYAAEGMGASVLYRRDNRSTNPCRTTRIGGTLPGAWRSEGMRLLWNVATEGAAFRVPAMSHDEVEAMPGGTRLMVGASTYEKESVGPNAGKWRSSRGRTYWYVATDFTVSSIQYVRFP